MASKQATMRPAVFLIMTLVLSAPTLAEVASGSTSLISAGLRLAAAIVFSWAAVATVGRLLDNYRSEPQGAPRGAHQGHEP